MSWHLRIAFALIGVVAFLPELVLADAWDAPASYYSGATGTGATLKGQLTTAMSAGHIQRTYGDFRYSAAIHDQDPNNSSNILLVYNRASVPATWDFGATWNREHTWPDSHQPQDADNIEIGAIADPHMLRPCNPGINTARGNKPYGWDTTTGSHGAVASGYYFPGDADKGDMARTFFYAATRWSDSGFVLVDTVPTGYQMGDLSSLIAWHYLDVPDEFERRRNHTIYSSAYNPTYYTNNRNAYVDRPEFVWSVYMDQPNDSQITIVGGTTDGNGGSTKNVDLGRVFAGGAVPAAQNFTLNKGGDNGTYYEVTKSGDATSTLSGRYNAFRTNGTDSEPITVGLSTSTALAGLKSGTVTVNNLDVTTAGGAGHGANDANDQFNVSLDVVDHAIASFSGSTQVTSLMYDFGSVSQSSTDPIFNFDLFNLEDTAGFTASLDFDSLMSSGDTGVFSTDMAAAAGSLSLDAGLSEGFTASIDTANTGSFSATYTLMLSDENLLGAQNYSLTLTLLGEVVADILAGDYNDDGVVNSADYTVWRDNLGSMTPLPNETESLGEVNEDDFTAWRNNFGAMGGGSGGAAGSLARVPEPASWALIMVGGLSMLGRGRRPSVTRRGRLGSPSLKAD